jgi:hypothetical protein
VEDKRPGTQDPARLRRIGTGFANKREVTKPALKAVLQFGVALVVVRSGPPSLGTRSRRTGTLHRRASFGCRVRWRRLVMHTRQPAPWSGIPCLTSSSARSCDTSVLRMRPYGSRLTLPARWRCLVAPLQLSASGTITTLSSTSRTWSPEKPASTRCASMIGWSGRSPALPSRPA